MDQLIATLIAAVWVGIIAALVWASVVAWRRQVADDRPLPFFARLEAHGLALAQAEQAVGIHGLTLAVRRCASCQEKAACRAGRQADCPNRELFERARGAGS